MFLCFIGVISPTTVGGELGGVVRGRHLGAIEEQETAVALISGIMCELVSHQ